MCLPMTTMACYKIRKYKHIAFFLRQQTNEFEQFFFQSKIICSFIFKLVLFMSEHFFTQRSHLTKNFFRLKQKPNQPSPKTNMNTETKICRTCNYIHIRCLLLSFFFHHHLLGAMRHSIVANQLYICLKQQQNSSKIIVVNILYFHSIFFVPLKFDK